MGFFQNQKSISFSLLLHAAFLLLWAVIYQTRPLDLDRPAFTTTYIEVEPLPRSALDTEQSKRVVQTEAGQEVKVAKPDAFMGEKNQVVDQQKVSAQKLAQPAQAPQKKLAAKPKSKSNSKMEELTKAFPALSTLGVALPKPGTKPEDDYSPNTAENGSLAAQVRGEYVKGFKAGEQTMLNTREYVFYGYFQRIRERLDRAWDQSLRAKLTQYFYKGRQLAAESDYTTKLLVTLDDDGQVIRVQLVGQSGTRDLDDAAIRAFNDAGPFPNPPKGLVDAEGQIQVRWDFVLRT
jgi:TonB family protein